MVLPATKKRDSLGASSHHKSSHSRSNITSVTVRKNDPDEKVGIKLHMDETGRIIVQDIAKNGVFADVDDIGIGDVVLSVNGKRLKAGDDVSVLVKVIKSAKEKVTFVVRQLPKEGEQQQAAVAAAAPTEEKKDKKKVQDNGRSSTKSYQGQTKHNKDGSIKLGVSAHGDNAGEQITVSASKMTRNQDSMIEYMVCKGKLYVESIHQDSIFFPTELEIGDVVLSINDMSFRSFADAKYAKKITEKAKNLVTLVVEKSLPEPESLKGKKKADQVKEKQIKESDDESSTVSCTSFGAEDGDGSEQPQDGVHRELTDIVIAAPKNHRYQEVGLTLEVRDGLLVVYKIAEDSIFQNTSLAPGDRILSINDETSLRDKPDVHVASMTMKKASEAVSLVIQKEASKYKAANFNLDASMGNLVW